MITATGKLEVFGYDAFFESGRVELGLLDCEVARVTVMSRGQYKVIGKNGEFLAKITGKMMFTANATEDYPAVGDWVAIKELENKQAVIKAVLPRKTIIKRKYGDKNQAGDKNETQIIGANIDEAFVVESTDRDFNLNRFERYFVILSEAGVKPVIVLNKIDLISKEELEIKLVELKERFKNVMVIATSTIDDSGLDTLMTYLLPGKTYCFLGSSGVGKSTLINKLIGKYVASTAEISEQSKRGKHITTMRNMYFLKNGAIVIDNPGMREIGIIAGDADSVFGEIAVLAGQCKFKDCTHTQEPGCRVLEELSDGKLNEEKYSNYLNLKKETDNSQMSNWEKRKADRDFGKFINKAKKDLKKFKGGGV
jgi:ribosome biogenesis GTPase